MNTLDNTPPTSHVLPLSPQSSPSFTVQWTGTDVGSGIGSFTIFVSDNGGPHTAFQTQTTATQATFSGTVGHTYSFYSIATDAAGNAEGSKTTAEATTTVASPAQIVVTRTLSRDSQKNVDVNVTIFNTGGTTAQTSLVTVAKIGTTGAAQKPNNPVNIAPGTSVQATLVFPPSVGASGTNALLTIGGTYVGGSFNFTSRITLP